MEEIEEKDPEYYEKEIPEHIQERYSKRFSSFGMSKEKRGETMTEIVVDGLYIKSLLKRFHRKSMIYQKANEDDAQIHGKVKEGHERTGSQPEKLYADFLEIVLDHSII